MSPDSKPSPLPPSFSTACRWKIGLDAVFRTLLVLAVVVMANYISSLFPRQLYLSPQTRIQLAPRTISILQTLTNQVNVTVYYDKDDGMFSTIMSLLNEYHRIDPRISVKVVDYNRDPVEAAKIAGQYHLVASSSKNQVIFDYNGHYKVAAGEDLAQYRDAGMKDNKIEFRPYAFNGQKMFTAMLQAVTNPKPFSAYFLQGDGEPSPTDSGKLGYSTFTGILGENYVSLRTLSLLGNADVPDDCNLLIIAGPTKRFSDAEMTKINRYLSQGGRLLVMLDANSIEQPTGLEDVMAQWGVVVRDDYIIDRDNAVDGADGVMSVQTFSDHPAINALQGSSIVMAAPRPVGRAQSANPSDDSLDVTVLAQTSENSVLSDIRGIPPYSYPLMVAVEQKPVKGVASANGNLRIIVIGDSYLFDNNYMEYCPGNSDFAASAINWLLDRPLLLNGIGPQPLTEFRLTMTRLQMQKVRWLLLAALPGATLALGGLVWLRRRK